MSIGPSSAEAEPSRLSSQVPGAVGIGTLSATPSPLKFAAIPYTHGEHEEKEGQNETEQVNIESLEGAVQIESVSISGPDASSFSVQYGDCVDAQLSENNSCDVGIRFQPTSLGVERAELMIDSDSTSGPLDVVLEGEGLLGPQISVSSDESQLGNVPIGGSASHTFNVENSGDYPLFIQQSFLVTGTPKMFPLLANTCDGEIVAPGSSCEFTIGFQPTTPGEKDASLIFITNATPQINVLGINGVGTQPATALPVTPPPVALQPATAPPQLWKLAHKGGIRRQPCRRRGRGPRTRKAARHARSFGKAPRVGSHAPAHGA
ncbi:MAG TPA: choice-of-anchor D domain-containing protein [Solirubrobacteraceae bacterium]|nr:choice-of-anchor D domain-containing protein [Solirubrobacteraceae bacterium]